MVIDVGSLPDAKPEGVRLGSLDVAWWRLDETAPEQWSWSGYPQPRNRFDAPGHRVRYAARTERGAFREHFAESRRTVTERHADLRVVRLSGRVRVLDLRTETTLDALHLDAEISTGRSERAFRTCWALTARAVAWWGPELEGIVYTSRTTPQTSANLAFFEHAPFHLYEVGRLRDRTELLANLIVDDGFRVALPGWR
jgi:hypothetical protein